MQRSAKLLIAGLLGLSTPLRSQSAVAESPSLAAEVAAAQAQLQQSFANLSFEDFGPSPITGPIYQAMAGGRILYFAPESGHLLFAAIYDRDGLNVTALAQDAIARKRLAAIDPKDALIIGPDDAASVIEFTDPDCPYCQALDRFWATKAAEGTRVRRLIYFVSGIHPQAAAKAEHILCSPDPASAFKALYAGQQPTALLRCAAGHAKVAKDAETVAKMGVSGTPTLFLDGKLISGFQQAEIEAFLQAKSGDVRARP